MRPPQLCPFLIVLLLTFVNNSSWQVLSCSGFTFDNECCTSSAYSVLYPSIKDCNAPSYYCTIFFQNCVVCAHVFDPSNNCERTTQCSCYYCCEEQYKSYCPQGCENCIKDGSGGCKENIDLKEFDGCHSVQQSGVAGIQTLYEKLQIFTEMQMAFARIDTNRDGFISMEEAIKYLIVKGQQKKSAEELAKDSSWFKAADKNGNEKIEPEEFDRMLGK